MGKYWKAIIAVLAAAAIAAQAAINDGAITNAEWLTIATAALAALGVYATPNKSAASKAWQRTR